MALASDNSKDCFLQKDFNFQIQDGREENIFFTSACISANCSIITLYMTKMAKIKLNFTCLSKSLFGFKQPISTDLQTYELGPCLLNCFFS